MSLSLHPRHIIWNTFGELEPFNPAWLDEVEHWEDYIAAFFQSNGLPWDAAQSHVVECITAEDKAPFVRMMDQLLPSLQQVTDCRDVDAVMLAHWTPDLHLGTSVVNHVIHQLNLSEQSFALAISDRGLSAPLFAFDALHRYLRHGARRGLLLIADQKHLLYRSPLMETLAPHNSACIVAVNRDDEGWRYLGYQRSALNASGLATHCEGIKHLFGLADNYHLVASPTLLSLLPAHDSPVPADDRLLCTSLFAALAQGDTRHDHLLLLQEETTITALAFQGTENKACD
ncbi:hypothetical protein [Lonsdalea populi]|uniref:Uncharacterized protein n=1 Tax=Lonsdalea populi TaxID=1172565 RepID=A0ABX9ETJ5_9GAMM|nr:hypothetical protein [Lonsdalea populi]OSM98823.1 hypothetical protein AU499_12315 [Lonsdalea populi]QPQ24904.1 hypothetical protein I6N93_03640 [Lonsdalea populi]RAT32557.1 hypothetical protein AU493_16325 [Lonsdalea populi]RAT36422.1 hypothetical protein AU492_04605 [Lonsdalea populi]RAT41479.1 hypothetical protein AU495_14315 [Lonsdalea populi]